MMKPLCFLINASAINTPTNALSFDATPSKQYQQGADQEQKQVSQACNSEAKA
jgi:hypothetical protein